MANVWRIGCGGHPAPRGTGHRLDLRIRAPGGSRPAGNVRLEIESVRRMWATACDPMFLDLLEIAAYVYAADQSTDRGSPCDLGARWRRTFDFVVPVRDPGRWSAEPLASALPAVLGFASEDEYRFNFVPAPADPPPGYFTFGDPPLLRPAEDVLLFSGGLDSLTAAAEAAVARGRHVVLVQHRSNPKLQPVHDRLVGRLGGRAGPSGGVVTHVPVVVNKGEDLTRDATQRTRSFLFAALAGTVARMVGRDRIVLAENGVIAVNLPLSPAVVGARASRTAHPRAVDGYEQVLTAVAGRPFAILNPFGWDTRADVLRRLAAAGCGDLVRDAVSCGGTIGMTKAAPHCGLCSQCVDRRFAVLAAGLEDHDPDSGYRIPVLTGDRADGDPRQIPAAYLDQVDRVRRVGDPAALLGLFGEAARVLTTRGGTPAENARRLYAMIHKHASEVHGVLRAEAVRRIDAWMDGELPAGCLLRLRFGEAPPTAAAPSEDRRDGSDRLVVDRTRFEVRRGTAGCTFESELEFKFVARLSDARGGPVSHDALRSDVWQNSLVEVNTIQKTASNVRKRLGAIDGVDVVAKPRNHYRLVVRPLSLA